MEQTKTYHWAMIEWAGTGDQAGEMFVQVVRSEKGAHSAQERARRWGQEHLSPYAKTTVRYIGKSYPKGVY